MQPKELVPGRNTSSTQLTDRKIGPPKHSLRPQRFYRCGKCLRFTDCGRVDYDVVEVRNSIQAPESGSVIEAPGDVSQYNPDSWITLAQSPQIPDITLI